MEHTCSLAATIDCSFSPDDSLRANVGTPSNTDVISGNKECELVAPSKLIVRLSARKGVDEHVDVCDD